MKSQQGFTIGIFVLLFSIIYFGFDNHPSNIKDLETERYLNFSATDASILINEAREELSEEQKSKLQILNAQLQNAIDENSKVEVLKRLSGIWYEFGYLGISGSYAEEVALMIDSAESWGIAATTYAYGIGKSRVEKENTFCKQKALMAFDKAISLDSENLEYQINKAAVLAEHPDAENPMAGIMQLLDINRRNPNAVSAINQLAKFGLKTNQIEKALERLKKALSLQPENRMANCLMVKALRMADSSADVRVYEKRCSHL